MGDLKNMSERRCWNCKWRGCGEDDYDFICENDESEYFSDWVDRNHSCAEYEEKSNADYKRQRRKNKL